MKTKFCMILLIWEHKETKNETNLKNKLIDSDIKMKYSNTSIHY